MIKSRLKVLVICLLLAIASGPVVVAKGWEPLKSERSDVKRVQHDSDVEIKAARGILVVNASHTVRIRIFSILGSLVADDTLSPGQYQYQMPAHGVYIVKAGDITCKVAL